MKSAKSIYFERTFAKITSKALRFFSRFLAADNVGWYAKKDVIRVPFI